MLLSRELKIYEPKAIDEQKIRVWTAPSHRINVPNGNGHSFIACRTAPSKAGQFATEQHANLGVEVRIAFYACSRFDLLDKFRQDICKQICFSHWPFWISYPWIPTLFLAQRSLLVRDGPPLVNYMASVKRHGGARRFLRLKFFLGILDFIPLSLLLILIGGSKWVNDTMFEPDKEENRLAD